MPVWRGVLVTPAEAGWIVQCCAEDLTSRSLQGSEGHVYRAR